MKEPSKALRKYYSTNQIVNKKKKKTENIKYYLGMITTQHFKSDTRIENLITIKIKNLNYY